MHNHNWKLRWYEMVLEGYGKDMPYIIRKVNVAGMVLIKEGHEIEEEIKGTVH